jgi:hypothetical protein
VQIQLAAMSDEHVALKAIDVDAGDRDFGASRRHAAELPGVGASESASRYAVGTVDEDFLNDVPAIWKSSSEFLQARPPLIPAERLRAADLDD